LLIVWINPLQQPNVPTNARSILDRLNEITFNATLVQEIEAIDAVNEFKTGDARGTTYKRIRLHEIKDDSHLALLDHVSKSNTDWAFLRQLGDGGREAAERWLGDSLADVGSRTTADMHRMLRCLES